MNPTFQGFGQSYLSSTAGVALALAAVVLIVSFTVVSRRNKRKYDFDVRPLWTEVTLTALYSGLVIGFGHYHAPVSGCAGSGGTLDYYRSLLRLYLQ